MHYQGKSTEGSQMPQLTVEAVSAGNVGPLIPSGPQSPSLEMRGLFQLLDELLGLSSCWAFQSHISSTAEPGLEVAKSHSLLKGSRSLEKWLIPRAATGKQNQPGLLQGSRKQESASENSKNVSKGAQKQAQERLPLA